MKPTPSLILMVVLAALSGCTATKQKQVLEKSTVLGFQAKTPGSANTTLTLQFGLVRNLYWSNPTSTNPVYAAPFSNHVDAKLTATAQTGTEDFGSK